MDHPNIARVFEAGASESGRPYFVMELDRSQRYETAIALAPTIFLHHG